ncbi:ACR3 family arsenite efflux transporter [Erysipelothrix sp. HDW6A]|uniref:ACR3 family arsenite efflux transporter n=1 Tax=Erysipelothrix sp. HDW6A TaxID=2714928 RepID=UPI00140D548D|nr:ACR3 family arsenite efflux transporter [Erysipelothrix sp. HDW6A]QIK57051.1 ACR3 family arsenite efflux transporter [Erysipelothrix sp. HDW6A]
MNENKISFFEKYLTVWVIICMVIGISLSRFAPDFSNFVRSLEYLNTSIPIAVLTWVMIFPMMMKVDLKAIRRVGKKPTGILISSLTSWAIKPFLMYGLAYFFFVVIFKQFIPVELAQQYIAGAVLLGAAPCTAMVFVWSNLTDGDPAQTLMQVSLNDIFIILLFVPIVSFLLGATNIFVPWETLIVSIGLFVVVPLIAGTATRKYVIKNKGQDFFDNEFVSKFDGITTIGLLLTLVIIFTYQGNIILDNPFHVLLIAVPLILQNVITANFAYFACKVAKQPHNVAAPAALIGASDFFELSVAVAIALFGAQSPVVLVTTVGVLTEVPVMLMLVSFINKTKGWYNSDKKIKPISMTKGKS